MGYRSDLIIAVNKAVLARDLIEPEIPKIIKQLDCSNNPNHNAVYYQISGWKWYDSNEDVKAIEEWFNSLDSDDFGAIRLGEDDADTQVWGTPYNYDVYINRAIDFPT